MLWLTYLKFIANNKSIVYAIFIFCVSAYYWSIYWTPRGIPRDRYIPGYVELNVTNHFSLFDTCNLTVFNHMHPSLLPFYYPDYNPKAGCTPYEPLTSLSKGRIHLEERAKNFRCKARCVFHVTERRYSLGKWVKLPSSELFPCDVIETFCESGMFRQEAYLHSQIYEQKKPRRTRSDRPDVYLIIIDSVSSFMAKRSLPKTIKFIQDEMEGTLMEFLNKIGHNSKPNGFPLVFGKSIEGGNRALLGLPPLKPDWDHRTICQQYLDKYDYHLHQYEAYGYKSMIAQDENIGIAYYPDCMGFNRSEANHIWRPFQLRMRESRNLHNSMERSCNERHIEMLDYLEKFIHSYPGVPKIGQIWPTTLAHETLKDLFHADDHFLSFFQRNSRKLENAFVFIMGDHGPRRDGIGSTVLGYYESNNPFLMVTVPKKYRNTGIHDQLRNKSHQLMTNFDLHATLMDILKMQPQANFTDTSYRDMQPHSKGSSLLREWRGVRNCRTLPIPPSYCLCQYNRTRVKNRNLQTKLGLFIAKNLNELLKKQGLEDKCHQQVYFSTLRIHKMRDDNNDTLYDVSVYLHPSKGLFSGHIRSKSGTLVMNSGLTRRDRYGDQGKCIFGSVFEPICQCLDQKS